MKKKPSAPKKKKLSFTPAGYHSVTPYLACGDAAQAIEFYKAAFGATEVMLTDEYAEMNFVGPLSRDKLVKETGG